MPRRVTGRGDLGVRHGGESDRGSRRLGGRRALRPAFAFAVAAMPPLVAHAETTLPDINVIATTPLSGTRSTVRTSAPAAPSRPVRTRAARATPAAAPAAPAPSAPAPATADPGMIDRDKVPSNTAVLTAADFDHDRS